MKQAEADVRNVDTKVLGKSGQISLGKAYAGRRFRVQRLGNGQIVLTAVALVPESQLWTLTEPNRSRIKRALAWASKTAPRETDLEALLRRGSQRARRSRATRP